MTTGPWDAPPPGPRPDRQPGRRRRLAGAFGIGLLVGAPLGYALLFPWLVDRSEDDPGASVVVLDGAQPALVTRPTTDEALPSEMPEGASITVHTEGQLTVAAG